MAVLKIGVIGVGNIGLANALKIQEQIPHASVTAICDKNTECLKTANTKLGSELSQFENLEDLINAQIVDAVYIATPHNYHCDTAIRCFKAGLHVLIEKPAGVHTREVRDMNRAAVDSGKVFSIMFNQRTDPSYWKLKELLQKNILGSLKRINWITTEWYRPQAYFAQGGWRATWTGEGGGVLINQAVHQLDLWQWLFGMPDRLRAFCYFGKYHDIEVEDDVTSFLEYSDGVTGTFVTGTGDAPGTNRLEVTGDKGKVVIENKKLVLWKLDIPERKFNIDNTQPFGKPKISQQIVFTDGTKSELVQDTNPDWKAPDMVGYLGQQHLGILKNFVDNILTGRKLIARGEEGVLGLSLSNAMYLSSWTDDWVTLPPDEDLFLRYLNNLRKRNHKNI